MKPKNDSGKENRKSHDHHLHHELLEKSTQIKMLETETAQMRKKNMELQESIKNLKERLAYEIQTLTFNKEIVQQRNQELLAAKRQLQVRHDTLKIKHQTTTFQYESYRIVKEAEIDDLKKKMTQDKKQYDTSTSSYTNAVESYNKLQEENEKLQAMIETEKIAYKMLLADIEKSKMITIDKMKKQMQEKASYMRNQALQIRKQQLDTTTRLTFLQNDQLIRELQYQSKNTEKILSQNQELRKKVRNLQNDLQNQQAVEKQLASRNVIAKNIMASLMKQKNHENIKEEEKQKGNIRETVLRGKMDNFDVIQLKEKIDYQQQIINNLDESLVKSGKKYEKLVQTFEEFKKNHKINSEQQQIFSDGCESIAQIMVRFYNNLCEEKQIKEQQLDFNFLKTKKIDEWPLSSIEKTIKILLQILKPHLSMKTLGLPYFKAKSDYNQIKYEEFKKKPTSKYYEAIQRRKNYSLEKLKCLTSHKKSNSKEQFPGGNSLGKGKKGQCLGKKTQSIAERFLRKK